MDRARELASFQFKSVGVETKVTTRSDVEAALRTIRPKRTRDAQEMWEASYGTQECDAVSRVVWGPVDVLPVVVEDLRRPSAAGAQSVSKAYQKALASRPPVRNGETEGATTN
mmetsp:Transcript_27588/g.71587  ORF Transcript_27588/g.71587 Transcript_27588/m.71587 type:complete len:113 (+) Transcript_27588:172-510(+)